MSYFIQMRKNKKKINTKIKKQHFKKTYKVNKAEISRNL